MEDTFANNLKYQESEVCGIVCGLSALILDPRKLANGRSIHIVSCILWHDCRLRIGLLAKVVSNAARPADEVSQLAENAFPLFI